MKIQDRKVLKELMMMIGEYIIIQIQVKQKILKENKYKLLNFIQKVIKIGI